MPATDTELAEIVRSLHETLRGHDVPTPDLQYMLKWVLLRLDQRVETVVESFLKDRADRAEAEAIARHRRIAVLQAARAEFGDDAVRGLIGDIQPPNGPGDAVAYPRGVAATGSTGKI